MKIFSSF